MIKLLPYLKYLPYIIIGVLLIIITQHKCPHIEKTVTKTDTTYIEQPPRLVFSSPVNITKWKHDTIISEVVKNHYDTTIITKFKPSQSTFQSLDTLRFDSLGIALNHKGNCLGIQQTTGVLFGKRKVITNTITNNIATPPQVFSLYGGVSNQIYNKQIQDITPNAMLLYKEKFGIEYGYGVLQQSHNIGLKFKIK